MARAGDAADELGAGEEGGAGEEEVAGGAEDEGGGGGGVGADGRGGGDDEEVGLGGEVPAGLDRVGDVMEEVDVAAAGGGDEDDDFDAWIGRDGWSVISGARREEGDLGKGESLPSTCSTLRRAFRAISSATWFRRESIVRGAAGGRSVGETSVCFLIVARSVEA